MQGIEKCQLELFFCLFFYPWELQVRTRPLNQIALLGCVLGDQKMRILPLVPLCMCCPRRDSVEDSSADPNAPKFPSFGLSAIPSKDKAVSPWASSTSLLVLT